MNHLKSSLRYPLVNLEPVLQSMILYNGDCTGDRRMVGGKLGRCSRHVREKVRVEIYRNNADNKNRKSI